MGTKFLLSGKLGMFKKKILKETHHFLPGLRHQVTAEFSLTYATVIIEYILLWNILPRGLPLCIATSFANISSILDNIPFHRIQVFRICFSVRKNPSRQYDNI